MILVRSQSDYPHVDSIVVLGILSQSSNLPILVLNRYLHGFPSIPLYVDYTPHRA